jgi:hypothetical protein
MPGLDPGILVEASSGTTEDARIKSAYDVFLWTSNPESPVPRQSI